MSDQGKWQIAFWIISGMVIFIGYGVINNDRLRASEDNRIEQTFDTRMEKFIDQNNQAHMAIMGDLREIKAKMGISNKV